MIPVPKIQLLLLACAAFLAASSWCFGGSAFVIDVATSGAGAPPAITVSSSRLNSFVSDLVNAQGAYASINGFAYTANTTVLGVSNALTFSGDAPGTSVTFAIPLIGYSRLFTGATRSDVQSQIHDFIKNNGNNIWSTFLNALAKRTPNAVTDGNPNSATGTMANNTFQTEGFTPVDEIFPATPSESPRLSGFGLGFNGGQYKAAGLGGQLVDVALPWQHQLTKTVSVSLRIPLNYMTLEGARIYGTGINLAVPFRLKTMGAENPWNWRITPLFGGSVRASEDLASGAALWSVGLSNSVDYRVNAKLVLCLVDQMTEYQSFKVNIGGYSSNPKIDQQILKNGLRAVTPLTPRLIGSVFVLESQFLKQATVKSFTSFGVAFAYRLTKSMNAQLGANYDTGNTFKSWSVGLSSVWKF